MVKRRALVWFIAVACLLASCSERDDGTAPVTKETLPEVSIDGATPGLMLTWIDEEGRTHVELRVDDVPMKGRDLVRIVFDDRTDGQSDPIYVADLSRADASGNFVARSFPRRDWEAEIAKRRDAYLAKATPPPAPDAPPGPDSDKGADKGADRGPRGLTVIIYGADWCKPCHEAADYLKSRGIPVVVKDIERDPKAQAEMQKKLTGAGQRGGSIPVIDVGGRILVGYSRGALDRALKDAKGGTAL
jgi:glutaredoxin